MLRYSVTRFSPGCFISYVIIALFASWALSNQFTDLHRFRPEAEHSANAGLHIARELLEPIKKKYPWLSYSDLWTLAGCVAVEELGGALISSSELALLLCLCCPYFAVTLTLFCVWASCACPDMIYF